jgi:hypothetical protein
MDIFNNCPKWFKACNIHLYFQKKVQLFLYFKIAYVLFQQWPLMNKTYCLLWSMLQIAYIVFLLEIIQGQIIKSNIRTNARIKISI